MLRRLRIRITLLTALLTGGVLVCTLLFAFTVTRRQYLDNRRAAFAEAVAQLQYQWDRYDRLEGDWLAQLEAQTGMRLLLTENGQPLLHTLRADEDTQVLFAAARRAAEQRGLDIGTPPLTGSQNADFTYSEKGGDYRCAVRMEGTAGGRWTSLVAVQSLAPEQVYTLRLAALFGLAAAVGGGGLALAGWFVAGRAVRPVGRAIDEQQRFLSAASHELRTPLAVIRANAGAALHRPDQAQTYLSVIDGEAQRMGALVHELLLLSAGASARARLWS